MNEGVDRDSLSRDLKEEVFDLHLGEDLLCSVDLYSLSRSHVQLSKELGNHFY